ncbi:hypothetical protein UA08_07332 [Talaromyces atroroseus]|uniref:chitinase n=1 Tax=Talaromyces atroroseus TaxID=1441469 RepID=A0A225AGE4_TALAT|nr:hypothetical protein UA08_07332 [Talaromyces atroroseus]OKL57184.1 hypothetical protein UA08_07332 [Talaromyces atroroseus]
MNTPWIIHVWQSRASCVIGCHTLSIVVVRAVAVGRGILGTRSAEHPYIGNVILAHTNLTEIKTSLGLMWDVGVSPGDINLGIGFYGRSYTVSDSNCYAPGCPFSSAGNAGSCTDSAGTLSYAEIMEYMEDDDAYVVWDETDAVNYMFWEGDQWVSFDNNITFKQKVDYANEVCLGGLFIWSVDQDTYDWQALSGLLDQTIDSADILTGDNTNNSALSQIYSAYTGTDCYISDCADINTGQCETGYSVLDYVHNGTYGMIQDPSSTVCKTGSEDDSDAQYRMICCPVDSMPESCLWERDYDDMCTGGSGTCGSCKFELVADTYVDRTGSVACIENSVRSLCCNTDPALEKCSWTGCGASCPAGNYTFSEQTTYSGSNLASTEVTCPSGEYSSFCCPSEGEIKGDPVNAVFNADLFVLITQRSTLVDDGSTTTCSSGFNKLCCDPPDASTSWPVNPKDLFEYMEDDISYYYDVQKTSNDEDTKNASEDPFALVMIDADDSAYDESLVDQWSFLTDETELQNRNLKVHKRHSLFEHRNDTFDNVVEVYHIQCINLYADANPCTSIFKGGAPNTIVKMPENVGAGPYARVIGLSPLSSNEMNLPPRSTDEVYELKVDYDFAAAAADEKGDVYFRIDYTNLQGYWDEITDTPAKHKRWFGTFDNWLKKMTTIVKTGSLPLEYQEHIKLFHAQEYCPKWNLNATFDVDAFLRLGLYNQYGYYFEGSTLPTPEVISAYGYFSIQPAAVVLMTVRANAIMQSSTGPTKLFSVGFPGMSVKGLISIGPEMLLLGQLDASLSVSGELNAGISVDFSRTEVYFPQDAAGEADTVDPSNDNRTQTYSFNPTLDATLSAEGSLASDSILDAGGSLWNFRPWGDLMSGYVTAGLTNTLTFGVSANATASLDSSLTAGFCYWADYVHSIFVRADMSFLGNVSYWGSQYDVTSPSDSIEVVPETCVSYSSNDTLTKRYPTQSLVPDGTEEACFGGVISCQTIDNNVTSAANLSCPVVCDGDSCTFLDSDSSKKRQVNIPKGCVRFLALWYNCDWFPNKYIQNLNTATNSYNPYYQAEGICTNVYSYLYQNMNRLSAATMGSNFMLLEYQRGATSTNRANACGVVASQCSQLKSSLWSLAVQQAPPDVAYLMQGYSDSMMCDEFPSNPLCLLTIPIPGVAALSNQQWRNPSFTGYTRHFTINLFGSSSNTNSLGPFGGYYDGSNIVPLVQVVGGVNTFHSNIWTLNNNAVEYENPYVTEVLIPKNWKELSRQMPNAEVDDETFAAMIIRVLELADAANETLILKPHSAVVDTPSMSAVSHMPSSTLSHEHFERHVHWHH